MSESPKGSAASVGIAALVLVAAAGGALWWQQQGPATQAKAPPPVPAQATAAAATVADATAAPSAPAKPVPATPAPPAEDTAPAAPKDPVREIPRKKLPLVKLDLDGDGKAETLRLTQKQPDKDWAGKDKRKGPRFTLEVLGADNTSLGKRERYGWGQGWAQVGVRVGGGGHVAMVFWSVPEAQETRASYAWLSEGKVSFGDFRRVPLELIDLRFAGDEAVSVLSQELYQDFMKRGTMQLVSWTGAGFEPVLEQPVFEVCVAAVDEPKVQLAVVEKDQRTLKLLELPPSADMPVMELASLAVKPVAEGPRFNVPTGFALSCDRAKKQVQYKSQRYHVVDNALKPLP